MQTFLTPDPILVEVRNSAGRVLVDFTDTQTTTVAVEHLQGTGVGFIDDLMSTFRRDQQRGAAADPEEGVRVDLRVHESGTVLIVDTDPARNGWRSSFSIRITAPTHSGLRAQTQSADICLTGVADRLDIRTASGDVQADTVERGSLLHTASGDIRVMSIGADAEIRSASGNIAIQQSVGSLNMQSISGNVRVDEPQHDVFARVVSGDIVVRDAVSGTVQATAVSGDIEIGIHAGSLARIDLSSISGETRHDFEMRAAETEPHDTATTDTEQEAAGRLEITCRSTSGDIRLRRAAAIAG